MIPGVQSGELLCCLQGGYSDRSARILPDPISGCMSSHSTSVCLRTGQSSADYKVEDDDHSFLALYEHTEHLYWENCTVGKSSATAIPRYQHKLRTCALECWPVQEKNQRLISKIFVDGWRMLPD